MVLTATNTNNVKVYTVSGSNLSRKLPDWLARRKRRELQKDVEWTNRLELIQDFGFPEAALRIKVTPDGRHCMATGVYKPQIRVYDFDNVSMKFERHTNTENIDFVVLSDDWTKSVHLQSDRTVEFHNEGQMHFRVRVPRFGRALAYHSPSCDVLVCGASPDVYRVNLDQGRFMAPMQTQSRSGVNVVAVNPAHLLYGFGTEDGAVEFWDPRARNRIGVLEPFIAGTSGNSFEISALSFRGDGLGAAVGTSSGHVLLYDLRQARPWQVKDQQYGLPIKTLAWVEPTTGAAVGDAAAEPKVLSADAQAIKLWSAESGRAFTSIEPAHAINDVCVVPESGLLFAAGESSEIMAYFVPQLGPAPRWAHFLENLTEEMEQSPTQAIYDDYKFVARRELDSLGLAHLIGSPVLKPYMHGFFIDLRLYERAKAIANPFAYEEHRLRRVQEKLAKARESRIRATTKLPKVNRALAQRLLQMQRVDKMERKQKQQQQQQQAAGSVAAGHESDSDDDDDDDDGAKRLNGGRQRKKAQAAAAMATAVLEDSRFGDIFTNPEFEVDEEADEFKQLHAMPTMRRTEQKQLKQQQKKRTTRGDDDSSSDDEVDIRTSKGPAASLEDDDDGDSDGDFFS
ncbi:Small ribosomal subunit biogenesis [Coemansia sp. RSA 1804]|nr:Small ribosomal subunit biogenesis [Coemansia sp. RSA 1804]